MNTRLNEGGLFNQASRRAQKEAEGRITSAGSTVTAGTIQTRRGTLSAKPF